MKFEGTSSYIATEDLKVAVNAAITLERPIIVKGEPGTGKTMLAHEVAKSIDAEIITWHIKSTTKAQQGLYEYDAVTRLRDSQLGDEKVKDIKNYISKGKLWNAFESEKRPVLLIDEIDKADIIFWNGPLGVIEHDYYKRGSYEIMEYLKNTKNKKIIIGGGETASIFEKDIENIYVSTGGGVLLEYIEKGTNVIGLKAFTK